MRKELSDTHRVILANAAGRENLRVLPVPSTISDNLVAIDSAVTDLLGDGLLAEIPADLSDTIWCKVVLAASSNWVYARWGFPRTTMFPKSVTIMERRSPKYRPLLRNCKPSSR